MIFCTVTAKVNQKLRIQLFLENCVLISRVFLLTKLKTLELTLLHVCPECSSVLIHLTPFNVFRLDVFKQTSTAEVTRIINSMKSKNSPRDVIPTVILKRCVVVFAPALAYLANLSFSSGVFPDEFKIGHVLPLLKKDGLDPGNPANYRPITNLSTLSKILEKLVLSRLREHVQISENFNDLQSAYRPGHSTETAILKMTNDLNVAMESQSSSLLLSLDISAAFDTIHLNTLLERLREDFGIGGTALTWLRSYLTDRECYISIGDERSDTWRCESGVPQGSVLGPLLFSVYVSPISKIFKHFNIKYHQYADDTQMYTEIKSTDRSMLQSLSECVETLTHWFLANNLQLNSNKTEAILFGTRQQIQKHSELSTFRIGDDDVKIGESIRILGVQLDATLSMDKQVTTIVKACNYHTRALKHVRKCLTLESTKTIAYGLVSARLDYCNSLLIGTSRSNLDKLQHVQNTLARVVRQSTWRSSTKPMLQKLHWLPINERIIYKTALISFKTITDNRPMYLKELLIRHSPSRQLRSSDQFLLNKPFFRTMAARRSFGYSAPSVWNNLTLATRQATSLEDFKRRLKTELFISAFI